ncbi:MAG: TadE/TadG family type IV pilus assembly protein [Thiolinea sp.]
MRMQQGHTTVEFALVGAVFLVLLFGIFELGRILFLWNTLTEATRRGARTAVTCPVNHPAIKRTALFNKENNNNSILSDMSSDDFKLEYLDSNGNTINQPASNFMLIRFVRFSVEPANGIRTFIPGINQLISPPSFATVLPIESMGLSRDNSTARCEGSSA